MIARSAVAHAVHAALVEHVDPEPWGGCAWYALVGSLLLNYRTGGRHVVQVGRLQVATDDSRGFELGACDDTFHAWIVRQESPVEIIDLAARHWEQWANHCRVRWSRTHQDYLWTSPEGLEAERVTYDVDPAKTLAMMMGFARDEQRTLARCLHTALLHLGDTQ